MLNLEARKPSYRDIFSKSGYGLLHQRSYGLRLVLDERLLHKVFNGMRLCGRNMHGQIMSQIFKLGVTSYKIGLGAKFQQHTNFLVAMDIRLYDTDARLALCLFMGNAHPLFLQKFHSALNVAFRFLGQSYKPSWKRP